MKRTVDERLAEAVTEAAVLAGIACEWCGSREKVQKRRACFCENGMHPVDVKGFLPPDEGGNPVCPACWTPAHVVRVCVGCRKMRGEE